MICICASETAESPCLCTFKVPHCPCTKCPEVLLLAPSTAFHPIRWGKINKMNYICMYIIEKSNSSNLISYWWKSLGIIGFLHHPAKRDLTLEKKGGKDWIMKLPTLPPEVIAHGSNSSLSSRHHHLPGRSRIFLWLDMEKRRRCQGESD